MSVQTYIRGIAEAHFTISYINEKDIKNINF